MEDNTPKISIFPPHQLNGSVPSAGTTPRRPNDLLRFFTFAHLQEVSRPICELALQMDASLPDGAEKTAGLRKLLEAKDCFVRASLPTV
jgi:hypothetical protein